MMIPLSVIDALIAWLDDYCGDDGDEWYSVIDAVQRKLEEIKKEAIPSLEQKIKDRIKELDYEKTLPHGYTEHECKIIQIELRDMLDELRKLLE